ncbi:hypothetical protein NI17_000495 [Thermobifida halotolerans]|uniref:Exonuclease domain-containing protein n=1 Tax=Thermobifida halotolerans TaxID=483545 RepID=A0AA97LXG3_9ACTN|nr:exonuclease domain-containing protein [Thermobifida halotolerans]UOE19783.1 hypothetical protein NI17_000495 [Thermobifida halotolerans]
MVFHYGRLTRDGGADPRALTFAVLGLETTGLEAVWGARLCEVAVVRMRGDGTVLDEYATLVDPGTTIGNADLHGITDTWVAGAPGFDRIADDLFGHLDDAVVVGHDLFRTERFLTAEFDRLGIAPPRLPGLCTLVTARTHLEHSDYRYDSLCRMLTGRWPTAEHHALEDARSLAAMLAALLNTAPQPLGWDGLAPVELLIPSGSGDVAPRAATPHRGAEGSLDTLAARLPLMRNAPRPRPDGLANYRMALERAFDGGTVPAAEAERLALLAARAGLTQRTAREAHGEFLARVPERVGAAAATAPGTVGGGPADGRLPEAGASTWQEAWRPRELTSEEYRARFVDPNDAAPEDLVIDPPGPDATPLPDKPKWEWKTVLFLFVLIVLAVAWQAAVRLA